MWAMLVFRQCGWRAGASPSSTLSLSRGRPSVVARARSRRRRRCGPDDGANRLNELATRAGCRGVPVGFGKLAQPLVVNLLYPSGTRDRLAAHIGGGLAGAGLILSGLISRRQERVAAEPGGQCSRWRGARFGAGPGNPGSCGAASLRPAPVDEPLVHGHDSRRRARVPAIRPRRLRVRPREPITSFADAAHLADLARRGGDLASRQG